MAETLILALTTLALGAMAFTWAWRWLHLTRKATIEEQVQALAKAVQEANLGALQGRVTKLELGYTTLDNRTRR